MIPERRRFTRWQVESQAGLKFEVQEQPVQAKVRDLSLKGLYLVSPEALKKDTCLRLHLSFEQGLNIRVEAWVCWHKPHGGVNCYGLYFTKIDDATKESIFKFLRKNYSDDLKAKWFAEEKKNTTKGGEEMEDKRIFERFSTALSVKFLDAQANREGTAIARDVSAKGIGLVTDEELRPETALELWLQMPDQGEPLYARGEVAWCAASGACFRAGVNFEQANLMGLSRLLRPRQ